MELEQILKQLDWLDEERRKDKSRLSALEERLLATEGNISSISQMLRELNSEITRINTMISRVDGFDETILQMRQEIKQFGEKIDKELKRREDEIEKIRRAEIKSIDTTLAELRKELDQLPEIKRSLQSRSEEEIRLGRLIDEVRNRMEAIRRSDEEYNRTIRLFDDGRRQDSKRLTDLSGEVSAMRKRVDEHRGRIELSSTALKKLETRMNEMGIIDTERQGMIQNFLENQTLKDVERERTWKEWQNRFQVIESQTTEIETTLHNLETTNRSVKRSQQAIDDLAQKVERRIVELTEIQRLSEERVRQEWVTFKADDQKRWTNYTLTLEEQRSEAQRQNEKLNEKVTHLEDEFQEIQDLVLLMNEQTEKRLQTLLTMTHEWVTSFERTIGRAR